MREKQRFLVYRWKKQAKLSGNELEELVYKEVGRLYGDFGQSLCGPRYKLFALGAEGVVIKVRIEATKQILQVVKDFKSLQLVHIAGSATLTKKAVKKKLPKLKLEINNQFGIW